MIYGIHTKPGCPLTDAWARLLEDERESWRLLLDEAMREGEFEMFVKIGDQVVNLALVTCVTECDYDNRRVIRLDFSGGGYLRIYRGEFGFHELQTWIEEQPMLLGDEK